MTNKRQQALVPKALTATPRWQTLVTNKRAWTNDNQKTAATNDIDNKTRTKDKLTF
jgi:hypothetical protein